MTVLDYFASVSIGCGIGFLIWIGGYYLMVSRKNARVEQYAAKIRAAAEKEIQKLKLMALNKSELFLRDKSGSMFTVNIIIDPSITSDDMPEPAELKALKVKGEAGSLSDLLSGKGIPAKEMNEVNDFVFSQKCVDQMREAGMEPDEVVVKMLRATGRID